MFPIRSLKDNAEQERCESPHVSSFVIDDLMKTTLGPKGMDKILVSGDAENQNLHASNGGATILKSIGVDNPAAKVLVDRAQFEKLCLLFKNIVHVSDTVINQNAYLVQLVSKLQNEQRVRGGEHTDSQPCANIECARMRSLCHSFINKLS